MRRERTEPTLENALAAWQDGVALATGKSCGGEKGQRERSAELREYLARFEGQVGGRASAQGPACPRHRPRPDGQRLPRHRARPGAGKACPPRDKGRGRGGVVATPRGPLATRTGLPPDSVAR